jgi:hypothetical protein
MGRITIRDRIGKQWEELRGHAKWELIRWIVPAAIAGVSTVIPIAIRWIQNIRHAPQQDLLGYIILAVLIFIALSISVLPFVLRKSKTDHKSLAPPETLALEQTPKEASQAPLTPPPAVDLHGSVEALYFLRQTGLPFAVNYSVYLKLRITNRGPDEVVITKWYLYVNIGEEDKVQGSSVDLPLNMAIKRSDSSIYMGLPQGFRYESVQPDLTKVPPNEPYRKGIPKEGWVRFDPMDYGSLPPVNGHFFLFIEDSLGNTHWIVRKPQSYKPDGEIVELPDTNSTALGLSSGS